MRATGGGGEETSAREVLIRAAARLPKNPSSILSPEAAALGESLSKAGARRRSRSRSPERGASPNIAWRALSMDELRAICYRGTKRGWCNACISKQEQENQQLSKSNLKHITKRST